MTIIEALCVHHCGHSSVEEFEIYKEANRLLFLEGNKIILREKARKIQEKLDELNKDNIGGGQ